MAVLLNVTNGGIMIPCLFNDVGLAKIYLLFDTGATITVLRRDNLSGVKCTYTGKSVKMYSVSGHTVLCSQVFIKQRTIANLDIGGGYVWVAEGDDFAQPVLGRDLLLDIDWQYTADKRTLLIRNKQVVNIANDNYRIELFKILYDLNKDSYYFKVLSLLPEHIDMEPDAFKIFILNILKEL
ncbi:MAG: retropepsin-like domain-containing protein [Lachnospiraceae bacterium]|nr:retropepsin-like domain-containing protein [Lachnospiraceae bacterium]